MANNNPVQFSIQMCFENSMWKLVQACISEIIFCVSLCVLAHNLNKCTTYICSHLSTGLGMDTSRIIFPLYLLSTHIGTIYLPAEFTLLACFLIWERRRGRMKQGCINADSSLKRHLSFTFTMQHSKTNTNNYSRRLSFCLFFQTTSFKIIFELDKVWQWKH